MRDATPLAVSFALVAVYLYVGLGLLARLSTPEQVGLYDAAFRFMFIGVLLPSAVMSSIYAYAATQAAENRARFALVARELLSLIALLVPLPLIVLSVDPAGLMTLLYGEAYAGGAAILRILGAAVALAIVSGVVGPLIVALGHERATLRICGCAAVASVGLNLLLIPALDGVGAATVTVTTELLVVAPALVLLIRRGSVRIDGTQMAKVALAGGAAFAAGLGVATVTGVIVTVTVGVAVYVGLLLATGAVDRRRLELMARLRPTDPPRPQHPCAHGRTRDLARVEAGGMQRIRRGGRRVATRAAARVILEDERAGGHGREAGIGEDRPLTALDVHLHEVRRVHQRQHVAGLGERRRRRRDATRRTRRPGRRPGRPPRRPPPAAGSSAVRDRRSRSCGEAARRSPGRPRPR